MSEWKELQIDNLPSDILTGDYEWMFWGVDTWYFTDLNILDLLKEAKKGKFKYHYRKVQHKTPIHEEIMSKYWLMENNSWEKVICYYSDTKRYETTNSFYEKNDFIKKESADIPPES